MKKETADVLIVGGGPAGAAAALEIRRAGRQVMLVTRKERAHCRPAEIMSPSARARLAQAGLPEPTARSSPCDGVLSRWDGSGSNLTDYQFVHAAKGIAVERSALHDGFHDKLRSAGVEVTIAAGTGARLCPDWREVSWHEPSGRERRIVADVTLIAAGRSSSASNEGHSGRIHETGTVALWFGFTPKAEGRLLLLEAATGGWWYVPPTIEGLTHLVFVTDTDLLPRDPALQAALLKHSFAETELIRAASAGPPHFERRGGMDARASMHRNVAWGNGARMGDAALALDPLSGSGIARAIEGGLEAARAYLAAGMIGPAYTQRMVAVRAQEKGRRAQHFAVAAERFPDCPFWRRRRGFDQELR